MPARLKWNSIAVFALACCFYAAFMFAKHAAGLRDVIPFGVDPYDAVGSFAVLVGGVVAIVALVRAFGPDSEEKRTYLIRSQMTIVLAVLITIASDVIAMLRHPAQWIAAPSRNELLLLLAAQLLAAIACAWLILQSLDRPSRLSVNAVVLCALAATILSVYPEEWIRGVGPHLMTIIVGDALLFAPMRPLLFALVPGDAPPQPHRSWRVVLPLAIVIGILAFAGEMSEGSGGAPATKVMLVATVFIGLAVAGFSVAFAFLGKPLGLAGR